MYHGELVWGGRQTCNCAELKPDGRRTTITCCLPAAEKTWHSHSRDEKKRKVVTTLLLLTGGRPPTGQKPPWQAVYTQQQARRPRVLVEPCESLGIRSCCELDGNQWKSCWVGHRRACCCWRAGRQPPARRARQAEASKLSLQLGLRTVCCESAAG